MRKFLAALMAVLMLVAVAAVLPVSAAEGDPLVSETDKTTSIMADGLSLVVTEYMGNTTCSLQGSKDYSTYNAFQYIEIYNRGTTSVNLYDLSVLMADDTYAASTWATEHRFSAMMKLRAGKITDGVAGAKAEHKEMNCDNPSTANLAPGAFAIIWFVNDNAYEAHKGTGNSMASGMHDGKYVYHRTFREHYKALNSDNAAVVDNALIVAVHAGTVESSTAPTFELTTSAGRMYALAKSTFDYAAKAAYSIQNDRSEWAPEIYCTFKWGINYKGGLLNGNSAGFEGFATAFVPANTTPDLYNYNQKAMLAEGDTYTDAVDYVAIDYVEGYKEMAPLAVWEVPTLGTMGAAQWIYVDATRAAEKFANGDTTDAWKTTAIDTFVKDRADELEESADNEEPDRVIILKDRDQLGNKGQNKKQQTTDENKGLPVWALILIIVGGVVLLGGGAAVLIIVLKKKNRPVAADDVAAEGEVVIIDETEAAEEAAEEAPAEETTEE